MKSCWRGRVSGSKKLKTEMEMVTPRVKILCVEMLNEVSLYLEGCLDNLLVPVLGANGVNVCRVPWIEYGSGSSTPGRLQHRVVASPHCGK